MASGFFLLGLRQAFGAGGWAWALGGVRIGGGPPQPEPGIWIAKDRQSICQNLAGPSPKARRRQSYSAGAQAHPPVPKAFDSSNDEKIYLSNSFRPLMGDTCGGL
jgi:hypothetical protein